MNRKTHFAVYIDTTIYTSAKMIQELYKTYYGGKGASGSYQKIINLIRPHDVYMELFLGNGTVFRHKKKAEVNILNDLSKNVYKKWLAANIDKTELFNCDAIEFLSNYKFDPKDKYCLYLDPPYIISSRREKRERYECEMSDAQHEELLKIIKGFPGHIDVIISTYKNEMYERSLSEWHLETYNSRTRQYTATEYLYMNYKPTGTLHQYDFLGEDFTDRQRIKRKIEREVKRLKKLPELERNAIIKSILDLA